MAEDVRHGPAVRPGLVRTTSVVLVVATAAATAALFVREHRATPRQVEKMRRDLDRGPVVRVARVKLAPAERIVSLPAEVRADRRAVLYVEGRGYERKGRGER